MAGNVTYSHKGFTLLSHFGKNMLIRQTCDNLPGKRRASVLTVYALNMRCIALYNSDKGL